MSVVHSSLILLSPRVMQMQSPSRETASDLVLALMIMLALLLGVMIP